jgi:hypothetical protein
MLPELSAVVERFHELQDVLNRGRFSQESDPLFIEDFRLLLDVFLLRKEVNIRFSRDLVMLILILSQIMIC